MRVARPPPTDAPRLVTVVSTEEEFDWNGPFRRENTGVEAARHLHHGQAVFDAAGVAPTYVVDFPIATTAASVEVLRAVHDAGRCEIGAHLHPWVTPPHEESVGVRNSFSGNLPAELERRKLEVLCDAIERSFGVRPRTYQAGRYGLGAATAAALEALGFDVDASASPGFDYSRDGGPDFSAMSCDPFWFGERRPLLALPMTGGIVGALPAGRVEVYRTLATPGLRWTHALGALARLRLLERLRLSPEGVDFGALRRLVKALLDDGVRVFVLGLHSPTFLPGSTPYVRDERELQEFLGRLRRFYDLFLGELGGRPLTASQARRELLERCPPRP